MEKGGIYRAYVFKVIEPEEKIISIETDEGLARAYFHVIANYGEAKFLGACKPDDIGKFKKYLKKRC